MSIEVQKNLRLLQKSSTEHVDMLCQRLTWLHNLLIRFERTEPAPREVASDAQLSPLCRLYETFNVRLIREIQILLEKRNFSYFAMKDLEDILFHTRLRHTTLKPINQEDS